MRRRGCPLACAIAATEGAHYAEGCQAEPVIRKI
jgi:hypothetical protein